MAEKNPAVSVIMPAYNAEGYIGAAIRSVMAQTFRDWELLVLDDCSADGTCAVAERLAREDPRIRLYRNPQNLGVARTRNRGLELCAGDHVAFLDCDDLWLPEKLEKQLALLGQSGGDLCYCSYSIVDENGRPVKNDYRVPPEVNFDQLLRENVIGCSTALLRGSVARQYRFQTDFYHEDYVFWLQLLRDGRRAVGCGEVLAQWRLLPNSRSADKGKSARNRWEIYRRYLKLPLWKSAWVFCAYALGGLRKYFGKK